MPARDVLEAEVSGTKSRSFKAALRVFSGGLSRGALLGAILRVAVVMGILSIWQIMTFALQINPYIFPSPLDVFSALVASIDFLAMHMLVTLYEAIFGFAIAVVVGVGLAIFLSHFRRVRDASYPIIMFVQTMPKVALAPVLLLWFGYGLIPKLAISFLASFFPILINTMTGLTTIDEELLYLTKVLGATPSQVYRKVRLANALPYMFAGFKVGITLAVLGAVVAEFVSSEYGLGFIIVTAQGQFRTDLAFAAIFLLSLIGLGLFYTIEFLRRLVMPWLSEEV
jgi:NitT/TauT family transport system permease protein